MTRILLVRHGATDVMRSRLSGRTPGVPLDSEGRAQARALGKRLRDVAALFASPMERAQETVAALAAAHHLRPETVDDLTEFDFGEWTNQTFETLQNDSRWHRFNRERESFRAPEGESMAEVQRRALRGIHQLSSGIYEGKAIALVSHADVIRSVLVEAAGTSLGNYWRFTIDPASITELICNAEGIQSIVRVNDCAHLETLAT